jgi:hypothetical protein
MGVCTFFQRTVLPEILTNLFKNCFYEKRLLYMPIILKAAGVLKLNSSQR